MQLVAYGAQDIYLTGNPQITFFKVVYRRHTNFSMEAIQQTFNGTTQYDGRVTTTISRNGDLVGRMYLEFDPSAAINSTGTGKLAANIGNSLLKEVSCEIGGQLIDKHYSEWLTVWSDLTEPNPSRSTGYLTGGKYNVIGDAAGGSNNYLPPTPYQRMSFNVHGITDVTPTLIKSACVPLQFWFCRNPGLALPLIALQYHEVKIIIQFCKLSDIKDANNTVTTNGTLAGAKLWVDYIYLDTDERRRFAQVSHEYLIEQVQRESFSSNKSTFDLNFNHPVKELIWCGAGGGTTEGVVSTNSNGPAVPNRIQLNSDSSAVRESATFTWSLKLNGHDRFAARHPNYFTQTQVWQHHTGQGGLIKDDAINVYSFALKPEEHQPSGTCNFSRIDNAQLIASSAVESDYSTSIHVYAVNYNVLRIMSGMGGLAYSN